MSENPNGPPNPPGPPRPVDPDPPQPGPEVVVARATRTGEHYLVDETTGDFIEPVVLFEGDAVPPNVIVDPWPPGLLRPRWNGTEWTEGLTDYEQADQLRTRLIQQAKERSEADMAAQYPDSANWLVDYMVDFVNGKRPSGQNQDQRMRAIDIIRGKRDRFIRSAREKTNPSILRRQRWEDEGSF